MNCSDPKQKIEVDAETAAAIEEGIRAADEGRTTPSEQVPKLIQQWILRKLL